MGFSQFWNLDTCRKCGGIADPGVLDEKYGIICEDCVEGKKKEPETVKTERVKK